MPANHVHVDAVELGPDDAQPPFAPRGADPGQQHRVVGPGDRVDGAAHERALDRVFLDQGLGQRLASEISQS